MRLPAAALLVALAAVARAEPPLTLDDALAAAARANPDLALARADATVSRADRLTAWSGVLPRLDLSARFGHTFRGPTAGTRVTIDPNSGAPIVVTGTPATDVASHSVSLALSQTVFDWKQFQGIASAEWSTRAAERQLDETALSIAFQVTDRFYGLVREARSLAVLEKTTARSEALVTRADALFVAGRSPKSDTYTARVNLQNDRIAAEAQRIRVAEARTALAQVLGRAEADGLEVVAPAPLDAPGLPGGEPPALDGLLARARERRPALAAQRALLEAADAAVSSAQAGFLPALSAQASYGRSGPELGGYEGVYDDPTRAYLASAQLVLSMNLFEGRRTTASVQRARGSLDRTRASADKTWEQVAKEIADARSRVLSFALRVALSADTLGVAQQALKLATERLDAGLASQLEVRDASLKLTQAELSLVETRINHAVAVSDLSRAVGGTL